jgi:hypothetical protein
MDGLNGKRARKRDRRYARALASRRRYRSAFRRHLGDGVAERHRLPSLTFDFKHPKATNPVTVIRDQSSTSLDIQEATLR